MKDLYGTSVKFIVSVVYLGIFVICEKVKVFRARGAKIYFGIS